MSDAAGTAAVAAREHRLLVGVTREIEAVLASIWRLRDAALPLLEGRRPPRRGDLLALRPSAIEVLRRHEGLAAGAGVVLAPGVLADAERSIEWWWEDRGAGHERLDVDLDPDSAEFYDYTGEEWYRQPLRTGRACVAGPYVDYICTHEYTFTIAVPITPGGRFAGVAGVDILAAQVERAVVPGLRRLDGIAVLASAEGRVIASNTARLTPGMVLEQPHRELAASACASADALPWTLIGAGARS